MTPNHALQRTGTSGLRPLVPAADGNRWASLSLALYLDLQKGTRMTRALGLVLGLLFCSACIAQTSFNTMGSDDSTAISGYDPVAFHTIKKALRGDPKVSHSYGGAKWLFASEENRKIF
jgi:hypothetical protein